LLEALNAKPMRHYGGASAAISSSASSGRTCAPAAESFEYADWLKAGVNVDYHIAVEQHFYSVPHTLVPLHERLDVRLTATPSRSSTAASASPRTAVALSRPPHDAHRAHAQGASGARGLAPSRFVDWATTIGPQTEPS